ncbi:cell envelope integrity protein CreD [Novosphingobium album (ex Liu et al. 2023)]|uniref:Cell envelope integrity protein CreD n=1 Tax=Novosphingobium album (ex Liu et al. 2023) TaxID=3031130 RepID=A0ABT5WJ67_9SPHN|nr:cell envelope integrity protein CreD [Novosphingobium album (ex Liu et al. 2023)]MDE8650095.1 cell envelope integrity protein CreD [Novosphingobium album (ex Liu et al. 2023)]
MSEEDLRKDRSPGLKLLFAALIGLALMIPLLLVYALVYDRQDQSNTAQASINAGWGGPQVVAGPVLVVPYRTAETQNQVIDGQTVSRTVEVERELFVSPVENRVETNVVPQERRKSIYRTVLYEAAVKGAARFALPGDLPRFGVKPGQLIWERAELRVGASDARGLTRGGTITANGKPLAVEPGKGPGATGGQGFFAFVPWDGAGTLAVAYEFGLRGSRSLSLVPRGGQTRWHVASSWPSPSFGGGFLPERRTVSGKGFGADYTIDKLALGQAPVSADDPGPPVIDATGTYMPGPIVTDGAPGQSLAVTVGLVEPVDLYSKVNRSVKYGFLFIGFTFLAFLLFDVVGGARVAPAEYLLTGAGLVLFFVLLLAFAEVIGFTGAYLLAGGAIIGLLTAYSAAVLKSWKRAGFIGALLVGLYAVLFVLLNLEALSLLIGSVLLFVALAGVMYATRNIDWSNVGRREIAAN